MISEETKVNQFTKTYLTLETKFGNVLLRSCYLCVIISGLFFNQQYPNLGNKQEKCE